MRCFLRSGPVYGVATGAPCSRVIIRASQSIAGTGSKSAKRSGAFTSTSRRSKSSSRLDQVADMAEARQCACPGSGQKTEEPRS